MALILNPVSEQEVERKSESAYKAVGRSEEHTSELQSRPHLVCRLLLEKKKKKTVPEHSLIKNSLNRPNYPTPAPNAVYTHTCHHNIPILPRPPHSNVDHLSLSPPPTL